ncbi:MAG: hypothetical protein PUK55_04705 [Clostridiales bacterium]|nr:hypothetical protein [Clostridiales bacterium]
MTRYANGMRAGSSVWVCANDRAFTVEQITRHEAFHKIVEDAPGVLEAVRAQIASELGEEGLQALALRYAEAYEGCYGEDEIDRYVGEVCADAYAGLERFGEASKQAADAVWQTRQAEKSAEKPASPRGPPEDYSIETLPDGKQYVKADRQVIFGDDADSWSVQLEDYINGKIRRGQDVSLIGTDGQTLLLTATSAGKLSSQYTSDGRTMSKGAFEKKTNAAAHIDELATLSKRKGGIKADAGNRHGGMASEGWEYRKAYFEDFDGKYYEVTISAARSENGTMIYNIGQMKEEASPKVKGSSAENSNGPRGFASSSTNIREDGGKVNTDFSIEAQAETDNATAEQETETRNLTMDTIPKKAQNYLNGAARNLAAALQRKTMLPFADHIRSCIIRSTTAISRASWRRMGKSRTPIFLAYRSQSQNLPDG